MTILCRIGLHRWRALFRHDRESVLHRSGNRYVGFSSVVSHGHVCAWCGRHKPLPGVGLHGIGPFTEWRDMGGFCILAWVLDAPGWDSFTWRVFVFMATVWWLGTILNIVWLLCLPWWIWRASR
jgi:hypothetical protein